MNERIEEILNNSKKQIPANCFGETFVIDYEKFAKDIIKDVLGVWSCIDNGNTVEGTDNFAKAVVKRFGV